MADKTIEREEGEERRKRLMESFKVISNAFSLFSALIKLHAHFTLNDVFS